MSVLKILFQSVFPPVITKEKQMRLMRPKTRRIVASHSSGNICLQRGRYATSEDLAKRHRKAQRYLGIA